MLRVLKGGKELEKKLHAVLATRRAHGEWFIHDPTVEAMIQRSEPFHVKGSAIQSGTAKSRKSKIDTGQMRLDFFSQRNLDILNDYHTRKAKLERAWKELGRMIDDLDKEDKDE